MRDPLSMSGHPRGSTDINKDEEVEDGGRQGQEAQRQEHGQEGRKQNHRGGGVKKHPVSLYSFILNIYTSFSLYYSKNHVRAKKTGDSAACQGKGRVFK